MDAIKDLVANSKSDVGIANSVAEFAFAWLARGIIEEKGMTLCTLLLVVGVFVGIWLGCMGWTSAHNKQKGIARAT